MTKYKLIANLNKTNITKVINAIDRAGLKSTALIKIENESGEQVCTAEGGTLPMCFYQTLHAWKRFINGYEVVWEKEQ